MKKQGLKRKTHFLGTKIKHLRKKNGMTLEDLSVRCLHLDLDAGPSVSYLSMIENGKRVPSQRLLELFAEVFQRDVEWFFDESLEADDHRFFWAFEMGDFPKLIEVFVRPSKMK